MEKIETFLAPVPNPDDDVVILRCPDQLHFDPTPLLRLFEQKTPVEAEEIICRVLEDIAERLDDLQGALERSAFEVALKPARRIGLISDQMGMTEVSVSAGHVVTCLGQGDGIALEATVARLERAFDVAVSEVWNFREM